MRQSTLAILFILPLAAMALAAAPPGADQALAPWFQSLKQPKNGISCCSEADCRPVQYRMTDKGYEVFIDSKSFFGGPDKWLPVPENAVLKNHDNPTGEGIACWISSAGVLCFIESNAT